MKKILTAAMIILICVSFFGCNNSENTDNKSYSIAYVTDINGAKNEKNSEVIDGIEEAFDSSDFDLTVVEPKTQESYFQTCRSLIVSGSFDLIIASDYTVADSLISLKQDFPLSTFGVIGSEDETGSSMSLTFKNEELGFLAGVVAASETKSGIVGFMGGIDSEFTEYEYGFKAGVMAVDADIEVVTNYVGSFSDTQKAQDLAQSQSNKGVDIIFSACGASYIGVERVAIGNDIKIIDSHMYENYNEDISLGVCVQNYKNASILLCDYLIMELYETKNFRLGFNELVLEFDINEELVSEATKELYDTYFEKLRNLEIEVPYSAGTLKTFKVD